MHQSHSRETICDGIAIYRRGKKGIYHADFHHQGQHRRKSLKTTRKEIAKDRAKKLAIQLYDGTLGLGAPIEQASQIVPTPLPNARCEYIEARKNAGNQPKTWKKYDGTLRDFEEFAATKGIKRVDQVTLALIDAFRAHRRKVIVRGESIGPTQMYHDASLLKRYFGWCADRVMIAGNPLAKEKISRPPHRRRPNSTPTLAQLDLILASVPKRMYGPLCVLAFGGMRSANCRQLLVDDIDLDAGWTTVWSRPGARTKCGNHWRVPIHPRLAAVLRALTMPKTGYVFTAPPSEKYPRGGHQINMRHMNDDFVAIVKKLGMPAGRKSWYTVQSLRHFFKSYCLAHGVPRAYVDSWQGHSSIHSASDAYVHTFEADSQRLMKLVPFGEGTPAADAGQQMR